LLAGVALPVVIGLAQLFDFNGAVVVAELVQDDGCAGKGIPFSQGSGQDDVALAFKPVKMCLCLFRRYRQFIKKFKCWLMIV
jgi:hypothetical protein